MDVGLIAASCSWPGRAGSLSQAGRGARPLTGGGRRGFHRPAPADAPTGARSPVAPGKEARGGDGEGWAAAEGEKERREKLRRGNRRWANSSRPRSTRQGLSGNFGAAGPGCAAAAVPAPPRCAREPRAGSGGSCPRPAHSLPGSGGKEKPTSLARLGSTFLITWAVILPAYKRL